jgi:hypothetical protein
MGPSLNPSLRPREQSIVIADSFGRSQLFIKTHFIMVVIFVYLILSNRASANPSDSWLWVKGVHTGSCEALSRRFNDGFTSTLNERLGVQLIFDGQLLPCGDEKCARARLNTAGSGLALLAQSVCTPQAFRVKVRLISDRDIHSTQLASIKRGPSKPSQERPKKGAKREDPERRAHRKGVEAAERLIKGPSLSRDALRASTSFFAVSFLSKTISPGFAVARGGGVELDWLSIDVNALLEWRVGVGIEAVRGEHYRDSLLTLSSGARWHLRRKWLSPLLGLGLKMSHGQRDRITQRQLYDERMIYRLEYETLSSETSFRISPYLEGGLYWWGSGLQPQLYLRFTPLSLSPLERSNGALTLHGGLRW